MNFDAAIFDMDGVITNTTTLHSAAWKRTFDDYLSYREKRYGETFRDFTSSDYLAFVDGRPRYRGVESFLKARGIDIPLGEPTDNPGTETVCGLGNRKNELFNRALATEKVDVFGSTIDLIQQLLLSGIKIGVATSSKNCGVVLERAGVSSLFETQVDGVVSANLGLKGKPEPDIFVTACANLGVTHHRAVIVEDAVAGVQAGLKGRFGLVLGIARENNRDDLLRNGADVVVSDLSEITVEQIDIWFSNSVRTPSKLIQVRERA